MERKQVLEALERIFAEHEYFRYSYMWTADNGSASSRAWYEKKHSVDPVTWSENGHEFKASFTVAQSRKNTYAKGHYYRDGEKTTLTAIKNSYKRMVAAVTE